MKPELQNDLDRFCRVYQQNVEDALRKCLPAVPGAVIQAKLEEEFDLFKMSLYNRLNEDPGLR